MIEPAGRRQGAAPADLLETLAKIVSDELKMPIRFASREVEGWRDLVQFTAPRSERDARAAMRHLRLIRRLEVLMLADDEMRSGAPGPNVRAITKPRRPRSP